MANTGHPTGDNPPSNRCNSQGKTWDTPPAWVFGRRNDSHARDTDRDLPAGRKLYEPPVETFSNTNTESYKQTLRQPKTSARQPEAQTNPLNTPGNHTLAHQGVPRKERKKRQAHGRYAVCGLGRRQKKHSWTECPVFERVLETQETRNPAEPSRVEWWDRVKPADDRTLWKEALKSITKGLPIDRKILKHCGLCGCPLRGVRSHPAKYDCPIFKQFTSDRAKGVIWTAGSNPAELGRPVQPFGYTATAFQGSQKTGTETHGTMGVEGDTARRLRRLAAEYAFAREGAWLRGV